MFKCQSCKKSFKKQFTLVTKKRPREYHYYLVQYKGKYLRKKFITEDKEILKQPEITLLKKWSKRGWEIAKELKLCENCNNKLGEKRCPV